ncbi:MAG: hypothetical protein ABI323_10960 [Solirubrobacteraceae bacterium]
MTSSRVRVIPAGDPRSIARGVHDAGGVHDAWGVRVARGVPDARGVHDALDVPYLSVDFRTFVSAPPWSRGLQRSVILGLQR